jgi:hypothetical protein
MQVVKIVSVVLAPVVFTKFATKSSSLTGWKPHFDKTILQN